MGLLYSRDGSLETFTDADYAGDKETRKSKLQHCVALSTTEAEYVSATLGAKEIIWLKKFLIDFKIKDVNYVLNVDNTSALKLIKNPEFHQ